MLPLLIRLLAVFVVVFVLLSLLRGRRRPRFKCAGCRHCGRLDEDGVICRFGRRETFKNPAHIEMCTDFEPRSPA